MRASSNTKIFIESMGFELELKYISFRDFDFIHSSLAEDISDKEFVLKVLFNQFVDSPIIFEQFLEIADQDLISLGESFILGIKNLVQRMR